MAGIPLHITPLSYIRGSGSQYITTDINLRSTDTIKSKWMFEGQAGNTYGCYTSGGADDNFCLYAGSQSVNAYIRYNGQVFREFKPPTGTIHELEQGPAGFFDNGVKLVAFDPATFTCSAPMYIFMLPNSTSAKVTARCYGLTIFRDGDQAYNFIPARNELTGEVGFYESVHGVFYENAGTGAFSAGPEVNFSVKTMLLKRRRALLANATEPIVHLPEGYTRVEYILFDGVTYIDLGFGANENTDKMEVDFMFDPTISAQMRIISANMAYAPASIYVNGSLMIGFVQRRSYNFARSGVIAAGDRHKIFIDFRTPTTLFDGVEVENNAPTTGTRNSTTTHSLLGYRSSSNPVFKGRIYQARVWRNDRPFRNMIPCRDANNVGHMYDAVYGVMYSKATSSGSLTPGPDVI